MFFEVRLILRDGAKPAPDSGSASLKTQSMPTPVSGIENFFCVELCYLLTYLAKYTRNESGIHLLTL